jgi:ribosomal protein L11
MVFKEMCRNKISVSKVSNNYPLPFNHKKLVPPRSCRSLTFVFDFNSKLNRPGHDFVGEVHVKQIYEIALIKHKDAHMKHMTVENLCRCIAGSALSMGIKVVSGDAPASTPSK